VRGILCFLSIMICGGIYAGPRGTSRMSGIDNGNSMLAASYEYPRILGNLRDGEFRRIPLPRTPVNKGLTDAQGSTRWGHASWISGRLFKEAEQGCGPTELRTSWLRGPPHAPWRPAPHSGDAGVHEMNEKASRKTALPPLSTIGPWASTIRSKFHEGMRSKEARAAALSRNPSFMYRCGPGLS
jgi:hypothetical protein